MPWFILTLLLSIESGLIQKKSWDCFGVMLFFRNEKGLNLKILQSLGVAFSCRSLGQTRRDSYPCLQIRLQNNGFNLPGFQMIRYILLSILYTVCTATAASRDDMRQSSGSPSSTNMFSTWMPCAFFRNILERST
jgi:hypothetical protein